MSKVLLRGSLLLGLFYTSGFAGVPMTERQASEALFKMQLGATAVSQAFNRKMVSLVE